MTLPLIALLILVVAVLIVRAIGRERREYRRFRRLRSTDARVRVYRRWLVESMLVTGGLAALVLLAAWPYVPLALRDIREWAPLVPIVDVTSGPAGPAIGIAVAVVALVAMVLPVILLRGRVDEVPVVGDVRALLPRTRRELGWGAALAVNAGVVEELLLRLALPALLFGVTGSGPAAFGLSILLFGALHLYQGWAGILVTTALGLVLTAVYVLTGSIVWPILVHAALDLRSLVLIPVALGGAARK